MEHVSTEQANPPIGTPRYRGHPMVCASNGRAVTYDIDLAATPAHRNGLLPSTELRSGAHLGSWYPQQPAC